MAIYLRMGPFPFNSDCATYGTGPFGTVLDGCGDVEEGLVLAVLTVLFVVATCIRPHAFAAALLCCTSTFHLFFGEGSFKTSMRADTLPHVARLVAVNTREVTIPVVTSCLCFFANGGLAGKMYSLLAWALAPTVSYLPMGYFAVFDGVGVVLGGAFYLRTPPDADVV